MKIGIITHYYNSTNYGGVLQAYALCRYLNDLGHDACQITYASTNKNLRETRLSISEIRHKAYGRIMRKVFREKNRQISKQMQDVFCDFREGIPHTDKKYTKETIGKIKGLFDVLIVGSDQVWNPNWFDSSFMLDFAGGQEKKIAYSASIGVSSLGVKQGEVFQKYLQGFAAISTREHSAAQALAPLTETPVEICVDPTLLLRADEWDELVPDRIMPDGYVFLYLLGNDKKTRKVAEKFARLTKKRLVMIPNLLGAYRPCDWQIEAERLTNVTPQKFLSLIKYADCIITDSFHACVFSLLYQRPFFAFERGGSVEMSSRIRELLEMFSCLERFQTEQDRALSQMLTLNATEQVREHPLFEEFRLSSIAFLNRNLSE